MVGFGVETQIEEEAFNYFEASKDRFKDDSKFNLLQGDIYTIKPGLYYVEVDPLIPQFWIVGVIWIVSTLVLTRSINWFLLPGVLLSFFYVLWYNRTYYLLVKKALRKHGYIGRVRFVRKSVVLRECLMWVK